MIGTAVALTYLLIITIHFIHSLAFAYNRPFLMRRFFVPKLSSPEGEKTSPPPKRQRISDGSASGIDISQDESKDILSASDKYQEKPKISSFFAPRSSATTVLNTSANHDNVEDSSLLSPIPYYETILLKEDIDLAALYSNSNNDSATASQWTQHDGLLFQFRTAPSSRFAKVVAFDLDHTIIIPRSNHRFPVDSDDWQFLNANIAPTLTSLAATGHGLLFLSNQQGLGTKPNRTIEDFTNKVDKIMKSLGLSIDVFCALEDNRFRKPLTGMWEFYQVARGTPDMQVCFVGDAAGRPAYGTKAKDFSDSDIKMARNLQIPFYTPEKFFLKSTQRIHSEFPTKLPTTRLIDYIANTNSSSNSAGDHTSQPKRRAWPITIGNNNADDNSTTNDVNNANNNISIQSPIPTCWIGQQEVLVLVAPPASGKSTLAMALQENYHYVRVNRDELGSIDTCLKLAKEALTAGKSVVVDNTNINRTARSVWVKLVRDFNMNHATNDDANSQERVKLRAIVLDVPKEICFQLAKYRLANPTTRVADRRHIPSMVMHSFFKNKEDVEQVKEGFDRVDVVPFRAQLPNDAVGQRLFRMYLS